MFTYKLNLLTAVNKARDKKETLLFVQEQCFITNEKTMKMNFSYFDSKYLLYWLVHIFFYMFFIKTLKIVSEFDKKVFLKKF